MLFYFEAFHVSPHTVTGSVESSLNRVSATFDENMVPGCFDIMKQHMIGWAYDVSLVDRLSQFNEYINEC